MVVVTPRKDTLDQVPGEVLSGMNQRVLGCKVVEEAGEGSVVMIDQNTVGKREKKVTVCRMSSLQLFRAFQIGKYPLVRGVGRV